MKNKRVIEISTDIQIQNCISSSNEVEIWMQGELLGKGNPTSFNSFTVLFQDERYLRSNITLITRGSYFRVLK